MVQGDDCKTYILVLVDKPGCSDGSGGYLKIQMTTTGVGPDPIVFLNDPQERFNTYDNYDASSGIVSWRWDDCFNDGMVVGPLPYGVDWSVHMEVLTQETRGL